MAEPWAGEVLGELDPGLTSLVLAAVESGVLVVDADFNVIYANDLMLGLLGHLPPMIDGSLGAGDRVLQVIHEDGRDWPPEEWPIRQAALGGLARIDEVMGIVSETGTTWIQLTARPFQRPGEPRPYAVMLTHHDVSRRQELVVALKQSEAHFRLLAENSTDLIQRYTETGLCTYSSPACQDVLGVPPEAVIGTRMADRTHADDLPLLDAARHQLVTTAEPVHLLYRVRHPGGRWIWLETVARAVTAAEGRPLEIQASTRDVTARVEAQSRLARLALSDSLTGLANRAALVDRVEDLLTAGQSVALLFLDLDRFKVVNDSLGHAAGDELLRVLAGRLSGVVRDHDVVARLGGDEFVVVAAGLDEDGALLLTQRVQQLLAAPVHVSGHELVVSASIGVVVAPADGGHDAEQLLRDADVSMYRAKARGRARAVVWTEEMGRKAVSLLSVESDLRLALDRGQLVVHYQAQVELLTGRIVGVEALVRWQHPHRGLLLPGDFLEVAEQTGLVGRLGLMVLTEAAAQVVRWRELPGLEGLGLSVNLSGQELTDPAVADRVVAVLDELGLDRGGLTVEVLESVLLDAEGSALLALARFVEVGVPLVLDDFGTGSSSLLHLRDVPVDGVKVDRSFVAGLSASRVDEAIVRAVALMATDLGLTCVAEGVETEAQRQWLLGQGFTLAQGFLLHRPVSAAELTADLVSSLVP